MSVLCHSILAGTGSRWSDFTGFDQTETLGPYRTNLSEALVRACGVLPFAGPLFLCAVPISVNKYVEYVQQIVASLKDGETGEPIHRRNWDSSVMDLPVVKQKEQRRPALKAKTVNQLVQDSEGDAAQAMNKLENRFGFRFQDASLAKLPDKQRYIVDTRKPEALRSSMCANHYFT